MQKFGIVDLVLKDQNKTEKLEIILDNSQTEASCTIKQTGNESISGCGCSGCSGCGIAKKHSGLLVVSGNKITAVNKTGTALKKGDRVFVEINEQKVKIQAVFSLVVPVAFAISVSILCAIFLKKEIFVVLGFFSGIILGILVALFVNKVLGLKAFPEVVNLL